MPALRYRVRGHANKAVWGSPLPWRLQRWLSHHVYRSPPMGAERVTEILDVLEQAGVAASLCGGWGVSALAGRQVRRHHDLDLVIRANDEARAIAALAQLGYHEGYRSDGDRPMFTRVVLRDHDVYGHIIDLHPVSTGHPGLEVTTGTIDGRRVACLSATGQLTAHQGYRRRLRDRIDVRALRRLLGRTTTTLIIPVPGAERMLDASAYEPGMPPHITVLYPFVPEDSLSEHTLAELAALASGHPAFDFALRRVGRFPGVKYLAPEPAEPFLALTEAAVALWPDHPPYGGAFDQTVPHLTIAYGDGETEPAVAQLPITLRAQELWLMARSGGRWVRRHRFPLGQGR